ncbi:hypothetical protein EJ05DRAFT_509106 [Pseudovirgaria hyperparasitica]|uniref:NAD(P)-binding domain-containing protein n=1 Tax=Pseudovirgaria hyperparasitica TaxID=470096 RepID=A0A6A6WFC7_9PEZI|nr:uncharacterized protein EJ05DRAFT_509106 [Pseudovirgaria hyperparasitica]KAF2760586.1 hypothetical protein EJ05DRAFT_509106 [Pseudovirgaria hyperparasitica]
MTTQSSQAIAFFGATGGTTAAALALTLKAGYHCTALARTPAKLTSLLTTTYALPDSLLTSNLTITPGSIADADAIRTVLAPATHGPVSQIIFGIGGSPKLQYSLTAPVTLDNVHICETGTQAILDVLKSMLAEGVVKREQRPRMMVISTTGVSPREDVPWSMRWMYHYTLSVPHADKKKMEEAVIKGCEGAEASLGGFTVVRPTLLTDGVEKGVGSVRVGWEYAGGQLTADGKEEAPGPAVGYSVSRRDVGAWIAEEVVKGKGKWDGRCVSLTY